MASNIDAKAWDRAFQRESKQLRESLKHRFIVQWHHRTDVLTPKVIYDFGITTIIHAALDEERREIKIYLSVEADRESSKISLRRFLSRNQYSYKDEEKPSLSKEGIDYYKLDLVDCFEMDQTEAIRHFPTAIHAKIVKDGVVTLTFHNPDATLAAFDRASTVERERDEDGFPRPKVVALFVRKEPHGKMDRDERKAKRREVLEVPDDSPPVYEIYDSDWSDEIDLAEQVYKKVSKRKSSSPQRNSSPPSKVSLMKPEASSSKATNGESVADPEPESVADPEPESVPDPEPERREGSSANLSTASTQRFSWHTPSQDAPKTASTSEVPSLRVTETSGISLQTYESPVGNIFSEFEKSEPQGVNIQGAGIVIKAESELNHQENTSVFPRPSQLSSIQHDQKLVKQQHPTVPNPMSDTKPNPSDLATVMPREPQIVATTSVVERVCSFIPLKEVFQKSGFHDVAKFNKFVEFLVDKNCSLGTLVQSYQLTQLRVFQDWFDAMKANRPSDASLPEEDLNEGLKILYRCLQDPSNPAN